MGLMFRSRSATVVEQVNAKDRQAVELCDRTVSAQHPRKSTVSDRPRTAGSHTSFSRPRTANASVSRDEACYPPSFKVDFKAGDEVYSFPMPSPRVPATFITPASPLSESQPADIGVAIGSPSQPFPTWVQCSIERQASSDQLIPPSRPRQQTIVPEHPDLEMPLMSIRKNKAKWGPFGGLFTRRSFKSSSEESQVQSIHEYLRGTEHSFADSTLSRQRSRFEARRAADEASFLPAARGRPLRSPSVIQKEGLSPMFRCINDMPDNSHWVDDPTKDSPMSFLPHGIAKNDQYEPVPVQGTPTLVLNLPDPRFERYSVMFRGVLEEPRPSLLERRQSRLKRHSSGQNLDVTTPAVIPQVLHLEDEPMHEHTAASPVLARLLSTRLGKKLLSPVAEAFSAVSRPSSAVRRSKTLPLVSTSRMSKAFDDLEKALGAAVPASPEAECCSTPPTPMTFASTSDSESVCGTIDDLDLVTQDTEKHSPAWDIPASAAETNILDPYLRMKQIERQTVQLSLARNIPISDAMIEVRRSFAWKHPVRPRMVEVGSKRSTTLVMIAPMIAQETE